MKQELREVAHDPNAVFFYSFVQARAQVGLSPVVASPCVAATILPRPPRGEVAEWPIAPAC